MPADDMDRHHGDGMRRWACLVAWLRDKHGMSVGAGELWVECKDVPGAGRGLFASVACPPSTILFTVPESALINTRTLATVYVAQAYKRIQNLSATQQISLHLLLHRPRGEEDSLDPFYGPYISTLPREFTFHPLTWRVKQADPITGYPEAELLQLLPPSVALDLEKLHGRFLMDWSIVCNRIIEHPVLIKLSSRSDLTTARFRSADHALFMDYLWAWLNVNTRCIHYRICQPASDPDNLTLCPILDFANHRETNSHIIPVLSPATWISNTSPIMGDYCFVSCSDGIVRGQELFLRYGGHPNRTLFVEYGFVTSFTTDEITTGEFRGEMDIQDVMEHMILEHPLGPSIRSILEDEGYWGDWALDSSPPAHPSWRVIVALRLYHAVDELQPRPKSVPERILQSWNDVVNGIAVSISEENEKRWRESLVQICDSIVQQAETGVGRTAKMPVSDSHQDWIRQNIRLLWQEEREVAKAVAGSVRAGEDF